MAVSAQISCRDAGSAAEPPSLPGAWDAGLAEAPSWYKRMHLRRREQARFGIIHTVCLRPMGISDR